MAKRVLTALAAVMILSVAMAPAVSANHASPGCQFINDPMLDAHYLGMPPTALDLATGDRLTMAADAPTSEGDPTTVTLSVDGVVVDTAAFPGAVEYEITTTGTYTVEWGIDSGNATWVVGCNAADCSTVIASPGTLKSDSKLHEVVLSGATIADGDVLTYAITGVTQDEPTTGGWKQDLKTPDANGLGGNRVSVRGERNPSLNGRVYRISYTVSAEHGGGCSGVENVGVAVRKTAAVDDGDQASWNSFTGELVPGQ